MIFVKFYTFLNKLLRCSNAGCILFFFIRKNKEMKRKNRSQKHDEYIEKFGDIPVDFRERLDWMYDKLSISEEQAYSILHKRDLMIQALQ